MSTWHQRQVKTKLYHATKWTVVEDPPEQCMCLTICDTYQQAEDRRKLIKGKNPNWSVYILKPESEVRANEQTKI